jgi:hypothetical protein
MMFPDVMYLLSVHHDGSAQYLSEAYPSWATRSTCACAPHPMLPSSRFSCALHPMGSSILQN